jgi:hypothetical protein
MQLKIKSTRPEFRRLLRSIRKSSILKNHLMSHNNRLIVFDFESGEQEDIMSDVVREYVSSQGVSYEEI